MNILDIGAVLCSNEILIVTRFERNNNAVYYYKKERNDKFGHLYDGLTQRYTCGIWKTSCTFSCVYKNYKPVYT